MTPVHSFKKVTAIDEVQLFCFPAYFQVWPPVYFWLRFLLFPMAWPYFPLLLSLKSWAERTQISWSAGGPLPFRGPRQPPQSHRRAGALYLWAPDGSICCAWDAEKHPFTIGGEQVWEVQYSPLWGESQSWVQKCLWAVILSSEDWSTEPNCAEVRVCVLMLFQAWVMMVWELPSFLAFSLSLFFSLFLSL